MTTTYQFPILKALDVSPQIAYEIIYEGVESIRAAYVANKALKNDAKAFELYDKVQKGERLLRFIRINTAPSQIPDDFPEK